MHIFKYICMLYNLSPRNWVIIMIQIEYKVFEIKTWKYMDLMVN